MENKTTEKITININTMDLGYIDLLVNEGYYATRTEFIKTSIKSIKVYGVCRCSAELKKLYSL